MFAGGRRASDPAAAGYSGRCSGHGAVGCPFKVRSGPTRYQTCPAGSTSTSSGGLQAVLSQPPPPPPPPGGRHGARCRKCPIGGRRGRPDAASFRPNSACRSPRRQRQRATLTESAGARRRQVAPSGNGTDRTTERRLGGGGGGGGAGCTDRPATLPTCRVGDPEFPAFHGWPCAAASGSQAGHGPGLFPRGKPPRAGRRLTAL